MRWQSNTFQMHRLSRIGNGELRTCGGHDALQHRPGQRVQGVGLVAPRGTQALHCRLQNRQRKCDQSPVSVSFVMNS
jgi:hypothetical protein